MEAGTVFWITGLSGAGKTTVAIRLQEELLRIHVKALLLDGDNLRAAVAEDLGYGAEERLRAALRYGRLCRLLSEQGADVICSTISMYHQCREWNRANISRYLEVYLRVPQDERERRDSKGLYRKHGTESPQQMVGLNGGFEEPNDPVLVVDNHGPTGVEDTVRAILKAYQSFQ